MSRLDVKPPFSHQMIRKKEDSNIPYILLIVKCNTLKERNENLHTQNKTLKFPRTPHARAPLIQNKRKSVNGTRDKEEAPKLQKTSKEYLEKIKKSTHLDQVPL